MAFINQHLLQRYLFLGMALFVEVPALVSPAPHSHDNSFLSLSDSEYHLTCETMRSNPNVGRNEIVSKYVSVSIIALSSVIFLLGASMIRIVVGISGFTLGYFMFGHIAQLITYSKMKENESYEPFLKETSLQIVSLLSGLLFFFIGLLSPKKLFFMVGAAGGFVVFFIVKVMTKLNEKEMLLSWIILGALIFACAILSARFSRFFRSLLPALISSCAMAFAVDCFFDFGIAQPIANIAKTNYVKNMKLNQSANLPKDLGNTVISNAQDVLEKSLKRYECFRDYFWIIIGVTAFAIVARTSIDYFFLVPKIKKNMRQKSG